MKFELKSLSLVQIDAVLADAVLVLLPTDGTPASLPEGALGSALRDCLRHGDLPQTAGASVQIHRPSGTKATRLIALRVSAQDATALRKQVVQTLGKAQGWKKIVLCLDLLPQGSSAIAAVMEACAEATYSYTHTKPSAKPRSLVQVVLALNDAAAHQAAFVLAQATIDGLELAKEWANRPANHATPSHLAEVARALGKARGFKTDVLGLKEVKALGMGALMAVAQGSVEPLRFIVMHYQGAAKGDAPVVLVGKGITFDTGGISIKPAGGMDEMKYDMGGAASVLGCFAALQRLRPAVNVVGLIPSCENMPDGTAIKPGDVVTSMSGQTIEILNTDAEGRLILCDALSYAARFKPRAVIDIATLTGACVVALGGVRSGLFSSRDDLAQQLQLAGDESLDLCWRLPLDDAYGEGLKSHFADLANVAGREAGAVTAAKFLQKFVDEMPWAHLDIAGTAWRSGSAKGATGRPVPLLMRYLANQAAQPRPAAVVKAASRASASLAAGAGVKAKAKPKRVSQPGAPAVRAAHNKPSRKA